MAFRSASTRDRTASQALIGTFGLTNNDTCTDRYEQTRWDRMDDESIATGGRVESTRGDLLRVTSGFLTTLEMIDTQTAAACVEKTPPRYIKVPCLFHRGEFAGPMAAPQT